LFVCVVLKGFQKSFESVREARGNEGKIEKRRREQSVVTGFPILYKSYKDLYAGLLDFERDELGPGDSVADAIRVAAFGDDEEAVFGDRGGTGAKHVVGQSGEDGGGEYVDCLQPWAGPGVAAVMKGGGDKKSAEAIFAGTPAGVCGDFDVCACSGDHGEGRGGGSGVVRGVVGDREESTVGE
jgi:hypothetical protein